MCRRKTGISRSCLARNDGLAFVLRNISYVLYAKQAGVAIEVFRKLDLSNPDERALHDKGKKGIPMNISIAETGQ
jgi:hypothetical protein